MSDIKLAGADPTDFKKTGDGCTVAGIAPGGLCILNFRFMPTAAGNRSATVHITSNATNSFAITLTGTATNPVTSPAAGLKLCKSTITVGANGVVQLCRATNPPTAIATPTLIGMLRSAKHGPPRTVVVGHGRTTIPSGQTTAVLAKLTVAAMKALHASGSLAVQAAILVQGPSGGRATVKFRVKLRVKRIGKRKPA